MTLDLLSAYAASAAKVGSWAVVSALVFRANPAAFAVLALVRGTIGILNYTSLGLGPAMIRALADPARSGLPVPAAPADAGEDVAAATSAAAAPSSSSAVIAYAPHGKARDPDPAKDALRMLFVNGAFLAVMTGSLGSWVLIAYLFAFDRIHDVPAGLLNSAVVTAGLVGAGTILRLMSDAPGAVLQTDGLIAVDNVLLAVADAMWATSVAMLHWYGDPLVAAAIGYVLSGVSLLLARFVVAATRLGLATLRRRGFIVRRLLFSLLTYGSLVALAQVADFLYAPVNYLLINRLIDPLAVAVYAPAVQIDAGLLLLVGGLSTVLLPKSAVAYAAGDARLVRRYYVRGTLAAGGLLLAAAVIVWAASPWLFRAWLGRDMPATRAVLPLVLLHTVLGGSSGVGRSVLLATGRVGAFTASVFIAGAANVVLGYVLVRFAGLGLHGIVLATVIAVTARCVVWMPWYVLRTLRGAM